METNLRTLASCAVCQKPDMNQSKKCFAEEVRASDMGPPQERNAISRLCIRTRAVAVSYELKLAAHQITFASPHHVLTVLWSFLIQCTLVRVVWCATIAIDKSVLAGLYNLDICSLATSK